MLPPWQGAFSLWPRALFYFHASLLLFGILVVTKLNLKKPGSTKSRSRKPRRQGPAPSTVNIHESNNMLRTTDLPAHQRADQIQESLTHESKDPKPSLRIPSRSSASAGWSSNHQLGRRRPCTPQTRCPHHRMCTVRCQSIEWTRTTLRSGR